MWLRLALTDCLLPPLLVGHIVKVCVTIAMVRHLGGRGGQDMQLGAAQPTAHCCCG